MDANRRHPSKEEVRAWMARRRVSSRAGLPLPSPDEIRRELGWHQLPAARLDLPMAAVPLLLGEFAALTAAIAWYWVLLQLPAECSKAICYHKKY